MPAHRHDHGDATRYHYGWCGGPSISSSRMSLVSLETSNTAMSFTKEPSISLTYEQVESLFLQLDDRTKLKLAKRMQEQRAAGDWDRLIAMIEPGQVSEEEILKVGKRVRAKLQARRGAAARRR